MSHWFKGWLIFGLSVIATFTLASLNEWSTTLLVLMLIMNLIGSVIGGWCCKWEMQSGGVTFAVIMLIAVIVTGIAKYFYAIRFDVGIELVAIVLMITFIPVKCSHFQRS